MWAEKLPGGGGLSRGPKITERKVRLQAGERFAIEFGVRVDEVIQGRAFLQGREANVATIGEEDAIVVVGAEEILSLILIRFQDETNYVTMVAWQDLVVRI